MNKIFSIAVIFLFPITIISFLYEKTDFIMEEQVTIDTENELINIDLENYIIGVVAGEMPALFEPEALKAQAVAARTYYLNHLNYSDTISNNTDDQVYITPEQMQEKWQENYELYHEKIKKAVESTKGEIITYNNEPIKAYYYSSSNGYTESSQNVFNTQLDYLNITISPFEKVKEETITMSKNQFCDALEISCNLIEINNIEYDESNRVKNLLINNKLFTGIDVRKKLNLRSTDFKIKIKDFIEITTKGYGHGVGMSQYGANEMAKQGYNYKEILKYYYQNTEITNF